MAIKKDEVVTVLTDMAVETCDMGDSCIREVMALLKSAYIVTIMEELNTHAELMDTVTALNTTLKERGSKYRIIFEDYEFKTVIVKHRNRKHNR